MKLKLNSATKQIAIHRIEALFKMAEKTFHDNPSLAQSYINIARKLAMAASVRMPKKFRHRICKNCKTFIIPFQSCRVRVKNRREPHIVITCLNCGHHTRIPIKKREKNK